MSRATSEKAPCCCECCCPGPTRVKATFRQIAGTPCEGSTFDPPVQSLDGLVVHLDANPLEPGQRCYSDYTLDCSNCGSNGKLEINYGNLDIELRCDGEDGYSLSFLDGPGPGSYYFYHPVNGQHDSTAKPISGSCSPWKFVYQCAVDEYEICNTETGNTQIFEITLEDAS